MADIAIHFLTPFVCFTLIILGLAFRNYIFGILGGFGFLGLSASIFINNIDILSLLENLVIASTYFAIGAYVFVVGSIEYIEELKA